MNTQIAIEGFVGSEPRVATTNQGTSVVSFRTAVNHRRMDSSTGQWVSNGTSWYTVTTYGILADQVASTIGKGSAVVVVGDMKVRDWSANGKAGTAVEITASGVGLNLLFANKSQEPSDIPPMFEVASDVSAVASDAVGMDDENIPF
jgi:single-strand DNA-binding protein